MIANPSTCCPRCQTTSIRELWRDEADPPNGVPEDIAVYACERNTCRHEWDSTDPMPDAPKDAEML